MLTLSRSHSSRPSLPLDDRKATNKAHLVFNAAVVAVDLNKQVVPLAEQVQVRGHILSRGTLFHAVNKTIEPTQLTSQGVVQVAVHKVDGRIPPVWGRLRLRRRTLLNGASTDNTVIYKMSR